MPLGRAEYVYVANLKRFVEVYRPSLAPPDSLSVVVVPGNPGQGSYYLPYMGELRAQMPTATVISITHPGFELQQRNGTAADTHLPTLQEQTDHLVGVLASGELGRGPVVLVGHSIGAYMCLQAAARLEGDPAHTRPGDSALEAPLPQILGVISLFPFLQTDPGGSRKQQLIRAATGLYGVAGWLVSCLAALPVAMQSKVVEFFAADLEDHASKVTTRMLQPRCVRSALHMGRSEFSELDRHFDYSLVTRLGRRASFHCAPEDHWFPRSQYRSLLENAPDAIVHWEPKQRHGFVVSERLSADCAANTARAVREMLPGNILKPM